ncbi:MAG: chemotaxis protein [Chloroflexi bacterium]|nr:chemotaxis protein [Chloroflexota bacterium]
MQTGMPNKRLVLLGLAIVPPLALLLFLGAILVIAVPIVSGQGAQESSTSPRQIADGTAASIVGPGRVAGETARAEEMTPLDRDILALAKAAAAESAQALESAIDRGIKSEEEIFSTLYFPVIPPTSPPTYATLYDDYTDTAITPIEDRYLEKNKSIVFVVLVDRNGYLPSHNSKFSQPRTGDREADLKANRTKRVFNDVTGFRAAKNEDEFLLQIYRRDTGELMKDLSVPVMVKGKHWGGLRIGYANE